ncbi:MAG: sugar transferase [Flavisolibacter sp.]|jgi:putative colanic acid biosynthesis UDP-glucose lipid carrier transferase
MSYIERGNVLFRKSSRLLSVTETISFPEPDLQIVSIREKNLQFKRLFDIAFSLLMIVFVLSWLIPILAILIKLDSKGPVFFVQKRVGAMGKVFYCFKLRTMTVNDQANVKQAELNDPRITAFGKFLRLSCLDEFPQFLNVLLGNMSVVGPRPHMISDCREFSKIVKHYNYRSLVKPGITGMAQVKGYRGETIDYFDVFHRYKWDMFYVKNRSFKLDMRILRLTITTTLSSLYSSLIDSRIRKKQNLYQFDGPEYLN